MPTFKDENGRPWTVKIDVAAVKRIRESLQIDLMTALSGDLISKIAADPVILVEILWLLVEKEAKAANIADADFGAAIAGDALERAGDTFLEALILFFPPRQRETLAKLKTKTDAMQAKAAKQANAQLETPEFDQAMENLLQTSLQELNATIATLGKTSIASLAPPG